MNTQIAEGDKYSSTQEHMRTRLKSQKRKLTLLIGITWFGYQILRPREGQWEIDFTMKNSEKIIVYTRIFQPI